MDKNNMWCKCRLLLLSFFRKWQSWRPTQPVSCSLYDKPCCA